MKQSEKGWQAGWANGYHNGICQGLLEQLPARSYPVHDKRVLYVRTGLKGPFPAMDDVIIRTLASQVRALDTAHPREDLHRRVRDERPDVVLVLHGTMLNAAKVDQIRSMGVRTAIWMVDEPYVSDVTMALAPHYDDVFTHELASVPFYRERGCRVHYLPLAADTGVYRPKFAPVRYQSDVCFVGNAFWNRIHTIDRIAPFLAGRRTRIVGLLWRRLRHYAKLRKGIRLAWITPEEAASYYNGAKIVINLHRAHDDQAHNRNSRNIHGLSINPRTYEISAAGAFQLTDIRQDLTDHYVPGLELATYSTPQELVDRIAYFLVREDERRQIAFRGMVRTVREHSYENRISRLLGQLFEGRQIQ